MSEAHLSPPFTSINCGRLMATNAPNYPYFPVRILCKTLLYSSSHQEMEPIYIVTPWYPLILWLLLAKRTHTSNSVLAPRGFTCFWSLSDLCYHQEEKNLSKTSGGKDTMWRIIRVPWPTTSQFPEVEPPNQTQGWPYTHEVRTRSQELRTELLS